METTRLTWFHLTPPPVSVFPVTPPSTFPQRIQVHSLLHTQLPVTVTNIEQTSLPPKGCKIHLSCHFFVKTRYNSTLQQKVGTLTNLQDPYLKTTSNVNLSPTQTSDIKILFKRDSSFRAQTGLSTVRNRSFTSLL